MLTCYTNINCIWTSSFFKCNCETSVTLLYPHLLLYLPEDEQNMPVLRTKKASIIRLTCNPNFLHTALGERQKLSAEQILGMEISNQKTKTCLHHREHCRCKVKSRTGLTGLSAVFSCIRREVLSLQGKIHFLCEGHVY